MRTLKGNVTDETKPLTPMFSLRVWHLAHLIHDKVWLPNQKGKILRKTIDSAYLKKNDIQGMLVNIAVKFPLLALDHQLENLGNAARMLAWRENWIMSNKGGTDEYIEKAARWEHQLWLETKHLESDFNKPFDSLDDDAKNFNREFPEMVLKSQDPVVFIAGTAGENETGNRLEESLQNVLASHQIIVAKLPKGARWTAIPMAYEEAAKREAKCVALVFGTPGNGKLSTYGPIETDRLVHDERTIVLFDEKGLEERDIKVTRKLRYDDWASAIAYGVDTIPEAVEAIKNIMAQ